MAGGSARRVGHRILNGLRKAAAGLTLRGECIWPGVQNDLYVAHLSIYRFFLAFVKDSHVLDIASGSGYGAALLARSAASVTGVDLDRRNIRFASRAYSQLPNLQFILGDAERVSTLLPKSTIDVIASSNTLEHLRRPELFLQGAHEVLAPGGQLLVAVPPIRTPAERAANDAIPYHRSNLFVAEWLALFDSNGWSAVPYLHRYGPGEDRLDFGSPFPSSASVEDFFFEKTDTVGLSESQTLTAVFVLSKTTESTR